MGIPLPQILPEIWEKFLFTPQTLANFYSDYHQFIEQFEVLCPGREQVFAAFHLTKPHKVKVVLFGEDPYPRVTSANGIAFWDSEIDSWDKPTSGNALKNILKALLVGQDWADYTTLISECRRLAAGKKVLPPPDLFRFWIDQGVFLINTALTFSNKTEKKIHFRFWNSFHQNLIQKLNGRPESPFYILWGGKATRWKQTILNTIDEPEKIIEQAHPTYIHQFLNPDQISYSPFRELELKTNVRWLGLIENSERDSNSTPGPII